MATNSYVQAMADAQIDAKTLEECINGAPDVQVRSRLGRTYWTLATIDSKLNAVVLLSDNAQKQIAQIAADAQGKIAGALSGFEASTNSVNMAAAAAQQAIEGKVKALDAAIATAAASGAGKNGWTASLVRDSSGQTQQQINDVVVPRLPLFEFIRRSIANGNGEKGGGDVNRAVVDIFVPNSVGKFIDNVLTIQNKSTNGNIYGNAAIAYLDAAGIERGAIGYSRNSAIQPNGYYPDSLYVECGDAFAGDNNPSDFRLIVTQHPASPYFPNTSFNAIHHETKIGRTTIRGRGAEPNIVFDGTPSFGDVKQKNIGVANFAMATSYARLRERDTANTFSITTNIDDNGRQDNADTDSWQFSLGNGSAWIATNSKNQTPPKTTEEIIRARALNKLMVWSADAVTSYAPLIAGSVKSNIKGQTSYAMATSYARLRERNGINHFAITTNIDDAGRQDDNSIDSWEFSLGNGSAWIARKPNNQTVSNSDIDRRLNKMTVWDAHGNTLIGQEVKSVGADGQLSVTATVSPTAITAKTSATANFPVQILYHAATSGNNNFLEFGTDAIYTPRGAITYNRAAGQVAYSTTSDYRAKTVHGDFDNAVDVINQMHVVSATMHGAGQSAPMFIAHELQQVAGYAVTGAKDAVNDEGQPIYQQVDASKLVPLLARAIQELSAQLQQLKSPAK